MASHAPRVNNGSVTLFQMERFHQLALESNPLPAQMLQKFWQIGGAEAQQAIQLALAPSTRRSYEHVVQIFVSFRREVGLGELWPIRVEHLMQLCVQLQGKVWHSNL